MKRTLLVPVIAVVAAVTTLASCMKDNGPTCVPNTLDKDRAVIDSFIDDHSLNYLDFNTTYGAYMGVADQGVGSIPKDDSLISYKFTLSLMNGTEIGTTDTIKLNNNGSALRLKDLLDQQGQPTMYYTILSALSKGGRYKVILPSSLYFSCSAQTIGGKTVPGYSQLIYDYTLTDVKAPAN
ncbi:hypothetical protein [Niabella hirudinis]|uniref:hypothetical protein n=1 Tax=Niabella hirudinis TaxID=1285929 RepID=UPI003EBAEA85